MKQRQNEEVKIFLSELRLKLCERVRLLEVEEEQVLGLIWMLNS